MAQAAYPAHAAAPSRLPAVAILPWGNVIEDFLDDVGVTLEEFATSMTGGWLFGYIEALRLAKVRSVIFCVSSRLRHMTRYTHTATGSTVCVLPVPGCYAALRARVGHRPGGTAEGRAPTAERPYTVSRAMRNVKDYLATPVRMLGRELRRERCDAILCQEYEYPRFDVCVALGALLRLPVRASFQGGDWQNGRLEMLIRPHAIRRCAGLIVPSASEASRVERQYGLDPAKVSRIFNPVDVRQWRPTDRAEARTALDIPAEARVAIWHGRVDIPRKGLDVLLDAWRLIVTRRPGLDLRLLLVGTGADADEFARRLAEDPVPGVKWRNEYLLDREMMRQLLCAADMYVFPSRHEGFPVAPLEAMACGLPVVAAAADGVPDIFENGEADGGFIVSCGDARALAQAMESLLVSTARAREMGLAARRRIDAAFSLETVGRQLAATLFPTTPADVGSQRRVTPRGGATEGSATECERI